MRVLAWLRCKKEDDVTIKNELDIIKKEQEKDKEANHFLIKGIGENKPNIRMLKYVQIMKHKILIYLLIFNHG